MKGSLTWIVSCFLAVCVIQLAVPASMIVKREAALRRGEVYLFKTAPVDPYDAFRGRYVRLNVEQGRVEGTWNDERLRRGAVVFALLDRDEEGFAKLTDLVFKRPVDREVLKVRVGTVGVNHVNLRLPFDRYYMDEFSAPEAERHFFRGNRGEGVVTSHVRVRVRRGFAVIEDVIVDDLPIREWLAVRLAER
ncbi:MAG TPA: GDYXXLXY domain-containing protein [Kiritimatiellia bacterium]|nr:GDYXXLXY domain-containing protein [Kiritimatiellia bacterium]